MHQFTKTQAKGLRTTYRFWVKRENGKNVIEALLDVAPWLENAKPLDHELLLDIATNRYYNEWLLRAIGPDCKVCSLKDIYKEVGR